jgi:hypothetical protein
LGPNDYVLPEDGDRSQSPKSFVFKYKRDIVLDKNKMMDNVQKHNIVTRHRKAGIADPERKSTASQRFAKHTLAQQ